MSTRDADIADAAAIAELSVTLGHPADVGQMAQRLQAVLARPDCRVWVAESEGALRGWISAQHRILLTEAPRVEITALIVSPEHRRRGLASALVTAVEQWCTQLAAESVVVRSNVVRPESHAFYPALGFARIKTQHVYRKPGPCGAPG